MCAGDHVAEPSGANSPSHRGRAPALLLVLLRRLDSPVVRVCPVICSSNAFSGLIAPPSSWPRVKVTADSIRLLKSESCSRLGCPLKTSSKWLHISVMAVTARNEYSAGSPTRAGAAGGAPPPPAPPLGTAPPPGTGPVGAIGGGVDSSAIAAWVAAVAAERAARRARRRSSSVGSELSQLESRRTGLPVLPRSVRAVLLPRGGSTGV